ncbi:hypothetical protein VDGL01_11914 [Verticillium dahliae]
MQIVSLLAMAGCLAAMPSAPSPGFSPQLVPSDVQRGSPKSTAREEVYDYSTVGAGVAGSTLANRLTARSYSQLNVSAPDLSPTRSLVHFIVMTVLSGIVLPREARGEIKPWWIASLPFDAPVAITTVKVPSPHHHSQARLEMPRASRVGLSCHSEV